MKVMWAGRSSIKRSRDGIPFGVSEYIKKHFDGSFLSDIKKEKSGRGSLLFRADVSQDNMLYHLTFNSDGILVEKEMEPIWELCSDEEYYGTID